MKKIKRIVAYVVALVMLVTLFAGCGGQKEPEAESVKPEEPSVTEAPSDWEEEPFVQVEKEETGKSEINYLEYTLSEENIATFESQLLLCEQMLADGASYADMEVATDTLKELAAGIEYQANIAEVLYYCNMQDEELEEDYLFSAEVSTEVNAESVGFEVKLYDSGKYARYFGDLTESQLHYLEIYSGETTELELRNADVTADFYGLQEEEFEEKIGPLYSEFVRNCNTIATMQGFSDYYEYASVFTYMRDYDRKDREAFRQYVKEYMIPLFYLSYEQYEALYAELSREDKELLIGILGDDYNLWETDYIKSYFETFPEDQKTFMLHMFEKEAYVMPDGEEALDAAFTTHIGVPFCYFGPGYQDAFTLVHEIGHYYASWKSDSAGLACDLREIQSQGNELMFLRYMEKELDPQVYEVLEKYMLYYFIDTIVIATLMDEFEEMIYHQPAEADYSAEDYDEIMYRVLESYGVGEDEYLREIMGLVWRNVGIRQPVYYLSYGTSAMASLNLYMHSKEDYEGALEMYRIILEEPDMKKSFKGTLEKAGMDSVFEEDAYITLERMFEEE